MSNRYKVQGPWEVDNTAYAPFIIECAQLVDTRTGSVYHDGATRVVVDGKPAVRGKGGTVPFKGERAFHQADALARDLHFAERFVRTS